MLQHFQYVYVEVGYFIFVQSGFSVCVLPCQTNLPRAFRVSSGLNSGSIGTAYLPCRDNDGSILPSSDCLVRLTTHGVEIYLTSHHKIQNLQKIQYGKAVLIED